MPTFKQSDVFRDAAVILQDSGFARWGLPDMNKHLNAGIRELALNKPNAVSKHAFLSLAAGSYQSLTEPQFSIIRALNNVNGPPITEISREVLDGMIPGWTNPAMYPPAATVEHILYDPADPTSYRVYPINDGQGAIEVIVAELPAALPDGTTATDVDTFANVVPLGEIYRQALVDYVISKCFAADAESPNSFNRSQTHYQLFANAIGMKFKAEVIASPKTTNSAPPA